MHVMALDSLYTGPPIGPKMPWTRPSRLFLRSCMSTIFPGDLDVATFALQRLSG